MRTLLGGLWAPHSRGRADGDDEASTKYQKPPVRSMELLVQLGEDDPTPTRSVPGERQRTQRRQWGSKDEGRAVGYIRDSKRGEKDQSLAEDLGLKIVVQIFPGLECIKVVPSQGRV